MAVFLLLLFVFGVVLLGRYGWARHELQVGRAWLERYHPNEARPHLETCLQLWPGNAEALLLMARAARRAAILEAADPYLKEYERLHGQTEELVLERILQTAAKGDVDRVRNYCRTLVEQESPAASLAMEAMAQGYLSTYRLGEGFAVLQLWLKKQPDNTQALIFQAGLKALLNRYDEAIAAYQRILELDPEHDTARLRLAKLWMDKAMALEAVPHLELLRKRQPHNPMVAVLLARCRDQLGHPEEAEPLLTETLAEHPRFPLALAERGRLALRAGRPTEAEPWLREALAQEPGKQQARYQLIQCLFQCGRSAEAEAEQLRLEKVKTDAKRIEKITTEEMPRRPHDPALHSELARLLLDQEQTEEVVQWLNRALKEDPRYVPAHAVLAGYYQQAGDLERATYHQRFLPTANPTSAPSLPVRH
ncbi:MAG TPA: tetratricopeptide repeat protein [Gemmataceae bacterium]